MSVVSSFAKIRPRRGTLANWSAENPLLDEGEFVMEVPDSGIGTGLTKIKVGDNIIVTAIDGVKLKVKKGE